MREEREKREREKREREKREERREKKQKKQKKKKKKQADRPTESRTGCTTTCRLRICGEQAAQRRADRELAEDRTRNNRCMLYHAAIGHYDLQTFAYLLAFSLNINV